MSKSQAKQLVTPGFIPVQTARLTLGQYVVEFYDPISDEEDGRIDLQTIIGRGEEVTVGATMGEEDAKRFESLMFSYPELHLQLREKQVIFPASKPRPGCIRYFELGEGKDTWYHYAGPMDTCRKGVLLVYIYKPEDRKKN